MSMAADFYELKSENLTGLGSPMGTERTWTNWRRFYKTVEAAQAAAEKDYGKKIHWCPVFAHMQYKNETHSLLRSGDLGHVMYYITAIKCEE